MSHHHVCSCGRKYSRVEWNRLERIGVQPDPVAPIELRNCVCGSTRAVEITPQEAALIADNNLVARMTALADKATEDCARAIQRAKATTDLLGRALFVALQEPPRSQSGRSAWRPSYSLVRGGK